MKSLRWARRGALGVWLLLLAPACGGSNEAAGPSGSGGGGGIGADGGGAGTGAEAGAAGTGGAGGTVACVPMPACDAPLPDPGPARPWNHTLSGITSATGFDNHRGYDLVLTPDMDQWVLGKFAYGVIDKDIHDEEVDLWLDRECSGNWELLGTALTTNDGDHATVEGVTDTGGRIYYQIPAAQKLGLGRHRIWMVVAGDLTSALQYIEVVPQGTHYFVSDVDGTLTINENEEYTAILTGSISPENPDSPQAFNDLAAAGYRPMYLSARPEFLVGRSRDFVAAHGFPLGLVRTTLGLGAVGAPAAAFKQGQLQDLQGRGMLVDYGFGNTSTDADAYDSANIQPLDHRIFFQYTDAAYGGRRIDAYSELLPEFSALPSVCP